MGKPKTKKPTEPPDAASTSSIGLTCGVTEDNGDADGGHITCGIPVHKDVATGEPFVLPMYIEPKLPTTLKPGTAGTYWPLTATNTADDQPLRVVHEEDDPPPTEMEQAMASLASAHRRRDAVRLLNRFLSAGIAAAPKTKGIAINYYPVPTKGAPKGVLHGI